jgi:hypothetical protein
VVALIAFLLGIAFERHHRKQPESRLEAVVAQTWATARVTETARQAIQAHEREVAMRAARQ